MSRPRMVFAFAIIVLFQSSPSVYAQAMAVVPSSGASTTLPNEPLTSPGTQTPVSIDVSTMAWQMGQLSPYTRSGLIGSATSSTVEVVNSTPPATINPFLGSTIGMNGGLTTKAPSTTGASTNFVVGTLQPVSNTTLLKTQSSFSFGPRFLSYSPLTTDYGLIPSMDHSDTGTTSMYNQSSSSGSDISRLASVPEPGTILLCSGLLAMIGYGWARRKQKECVKPEDTTAVSSNAA